MILEEAYFLAKKRIEEQEKRITELEGQRDELLNALIRIKCELLPYKTNPTADHTGPIDHIIAMCEKLINIKQPSLAALTDNGFRGEDI